MSGVQIMHIRCPSCVPRNYLQLWYSLISLETKIRSQKQARMSDFGLVCAAVIWGPYLLAPWPELGLPHVQIKGIVDAYNFGSQAFAIGGRLNLWICTERSCCSGLREYLSGWVDLVSKPPSFQSFTCWWLGPWVIWSLVHFMSWLVTGFMIFS
jgi:hypothetical protein